MTSVNPNDIRIGDDKWIPWIDFDESKEASVNLQLAPLGDLWRQLETNCVAECCGLDAFDFTPDNIQRASAELADLSLSQKLVTLRDQLVSPSRQRKLAQAIPGATIHPADTDHAACVLGARCFVPALVDACGSVADRLGYARRVA